MSCGHAGHSVGATASVRAHKLSCMQCNNANRETTLVVRPPVGRPVNARCRPSAIIFTVNPTVSMRRAGRAAYHSLALLGHCRRLSIRTDSEIRRARRRWTPNWPAAAQWTVQARRRTPPCVEGWLHWEIVRLNGVNKGLGVERN